MPVASLSWSLGFSKRRFSGYMKASQWGDKSPTSKTSSIIVNYCRIWYVVYLPNIVTKPKKRPLFASEATWKTKFACLLPMWYWCWHTSKSILQGTKHGKRLHCPVQVPLQIFYCSLQTASRLPRPKVRKHFPAQPSLSKRRPFHGAQGPSEDVHNWWQMTWDVFSCTVCLWKPLGFHEY